MPKRRVIAGLAAALSFAAGMASAAPVCRGADGYQAEFGGRRTLLLRPDVMAQAKAAGSDDPAVGAAWRAVLARADTALAGPVYSVVHKARTPPSGDKHDYVSGLRAAVDFVAPYVGREAAFPYPERSPGPSDEMLEVMWRAALAYGDPRHARAAADVAARRPTSDLLLTVVAAALGRAHRPEGGAQ